MKRKFEKKLSNAQWSRKKNEDEITTTTVLLREINIFISEKSGEINARISHCVFRMPNWDMVQCRVFLMLIRII